MMDNRGVSKKLIGKIRKYNNEYNVKTKGWYYTRKKAKKLIGTEVVLDRLKHITDTAIIASDIKRRRLKKTGQIVETGVLRYIGDRNSPKNDIIFEKYSANATPIFSYYLSHKRYDSKEGKILHGRYG